MSNKRLVLAWTGAAIIAIVVLVMAGKSLFSEREPTYQGRTVSYWLAEVFTINQPQALQVIRQMGPEAMPALARAFNRTNSSYNDFYSQIYPRLPGWLRRHLTRPVPAEEIWNAAELVLMNNTNGRLTLPELIRMLDDQKNPAHAELIGVFAHWIRSDDTEYMPVLIKCLHDTNASVRYTAVYCLSKYGPQADAAVAALTDALEDTNYGVKVSAANALWKISGETNPAAATLKEVIKAAPSDGWAYWAAVYLSEVDSHDTNGLPILIGMLQNPDENLRVSAASILGRYGPPASGAVPVLRQQVENGSPRMKTVALQALKKIDPASAAGYEHP
jgi:hypothetical protein